MTRRDQDQAATILQRSQDATMPGIGAGLFHTPQPGPPPTPPPFRAATPPPFRAHSAPAGGPQWNTPPPRPPAKKSTTWIPLAAAGAVFVLVLGALGAWWAFKGDDSSNQSQSTSTSPSTSKTRETTKSRAPRTTEAVDPSSADSKLLAVLPDDYDTGVCKPVHPPATDALATVDCGKTNSPGGPAVTRYSLFADQATLDKHFSDAIAQNSELLKCPGSDVDSPNAWSYNSSANPDEKAGQVACGTFDGNPDVTWTKDSDLLLADAQGQSMDELHDWWNNVG